MNGRLTHLDKAGRPVMVDVSQKQATQRSATARGAVSISAEAVAAIQKRSVKKGDVLSIAELAGIMGAKKTPDLIPLCHPLAITGAKVLLNLDTDKNRVNIFATIKTTGPTGVEMEALTAVATACLTVYDMLKAIDRTMTIEKIELVEKTGGASGEFKRPESTS